MMTRNADGIAEAVREQGRALRDALGFDPGDDVAAHWFGAALCHPSFVFENSEALRRLHIGTATTEALRVAGEATVSLLLRRELFLKGDPHLGAVDKQKSAVQSLLSSHLFDAWSLAGLAMATDSITTEIRIGSRMPAVRAALSFQVAGACWASGRGRAVAPAINSAIERCLSAENEWTDYKTPLQEVLGREAGLPPPVYELVSKQGPDHAAMWTVEVRDAQGRAARGTGPGKKAAGQDAAVNFLRAHNPHRLSELRSKGKRAVASDALVFRPPKEMPSVSSRTAEAARRVGDELGIAKSRLWTVLAALTHPSHVFEAKRPSTTTRALLGSVQR